VFFYLSLDEVGIDMLEIPTVAHIGYVHASEGAVGLYDL
jgi:hypothetical protein